MPRLFYLLFAVMLVMPLSAAETAHPAQKDRAAHGAAQAAGAEAAHGEGAAEAHAEKKILGIPEWVWNLANLIVFWGVLGYFLLGPVRKFFADRSARISRELTEASQRRTKADEFAAQVDERLKKLESEMAVILERARQDGERQRNEMIAAAETEAQKIVNGARNEVEARVKLARKELMDYAGDLATDRARRILEESLSEADRKRLFDESVAKIGEVRQ